MMTIEKTTPAIWVGDLAAYNAGILHGEWIKLDGATIEEIQAAVNDILDEGTRRYSDETLSVHEEFGIFDFEGFGPIKLDQYESLTTVLEHVERMGDDPARYFAYVSVHGEHYADQYDSAMVRGPFDDENDYAWEYLENQIGSCDLGGWLESKGMPADLVLGIVFDPAKLIREWRCASSLDFARIGQKIYAVESY